MKIKLEFPYNERWKSGYLVTNREERKTLILFNDQTDRSSTQYARYLLAISLGRYLTGDETVDHIDGNRKNDNIDNLQILSKSENVRKSLKGIRVEKHGTLSMYRYCKCDLCRLAKKEYVKCYKNNEKKIMTSLEKQIKES